ncbi:MAG TPA: hypothetical protein VFX97_20570 [Pyrinomonadaceae bacterium]|nr:hypothetical protein [Pyrinomonadaceae bacterium]
MGRPWSAVLARIGTPTGDRRIIAPGALTTRALPLPLMWQRVSGEGHGGAVTVGAIETLTIDNESGMVTGTGHFLDVRGADDAERQTEAGVTGPSVDLFDDFDIAEVQTLIEARVVGPDLTGNFDDIEYVVDENDMTVITNARIAGATLVQIPAFADVSITLLDDVSRETSHPVLASAADVSRETLPPLDAFANPGFTEYTHLRYEEFAWGTKVSGHIADWTSCHLGLPGCTTAPASMTGYAHFLTKPQRTSDGTTVPVGVLTAGEGHADPKFGIRPAQDHYDRPELAVAKVFAGEDEHGIWVSGWILPYADPTRVQMLKDLDVSGDWRQTGGNLELIAACAVNTGAYTQPRHVYFSLELGGQQTLIGRFARRSDDVSRETSAPDPGPVVDDARAAWARANWKVA